MQRVLTSTRASGARRYRSPGRQGGVDVDVLIPQLEEEYRQCSPSDLPLTPECRFQGPWVLRHVFSGAAIMDPPYPSCVQWRRYYGPALSLGLSPGYDVVGWWSWLNPSEVLKNI